ncbi:MAG TPA: serine/threonine-protein kinase [Gemmatimonadaceae bacterium]|nr:serine/threonine-protein kinase [Gemmatimonadaceae bacterium]
MATQLRDQLQASLGDAYRLDRELGGGSMARVFVAQEGALDRRVVVKVLPPELTGSLSIERFRREIQLAARVHHPHIVPVLLVGEADGLLYYTMPYIEGESLRQRLERERTLPIPDVIRIMRDVIDALSHAHALGVIHRDVKPDNILLVRHHALVTDFGVAKALRQAEEKRPAGPTPSTGFALGTPAYMAPEQAAADPTIDHRADIYALGCVAYEMLAGRPPFTGRSARKILAAQVTERPVPISRLRPDVGATLERIVMRCLEKSPEQRYQDADDLTDELNALIAHNMSFALTGGHPSVGRKVTTKRALGTYLAATVVVAATARLIRDLFDLPAWVPTGATLVMGAGLPVVLLTAFLHAEGSHGGGAFRRRARRVFTWRTTTLGGWLAVGLFAIAVAIYAVVQSLAVK